MGPDEKTKSFLLKQKGGVVEVGDQIFCFVSRVDKDIAVHSFKSPVRGIFVEMAELPKGRKYYQKGDTVCYIQIDHETAPVIKIISD